MLKKVFLPILLSVSLLLTSCGPSNIPKVNVVGNTVRFGYNAFQEVDWGMTIYETLDALGHKGVISDPIATITDNGFFANKYKIRLNCFTTSLEVYLYFTSFEEVPPTFSLKHSEDWVVNGVPEEDLFEDEDEVIEEEEEEEDEEDEDGEEGEESEDGEDAEEEEDEEEEPEPANEPEVIDYIALEDGVLVQMLLAGQRMYGQDVVPMIQEMYDSVGAPYRQELVIVDYSTEKTPFTQKILSFYGSRISDVQEREYATAYMEALNNPVVKARRDPELQQLDYVSKSVFTYLVDDKKLTFALNGEAAGYFNNIINVFEDEVRAQEEADALIADEIAAIRALLREDALVARSTSETVVADAEKELERRKTISAEEKAIIAAQEAEDAAKRKVKTAEELKAEEEARLKREQELLALAEAEAERLANS